MLFGSEVSSIRFIYEERMLDLQVEKVRLVRIAFREDRQESVSEQRIHGIQTVLGLGRQ